jgi:hypothetical protein
MLQPQLSNDGIQFPDLVGSGIRIAGGFVRSTPPKKIKGNDSTRWREIRNQTVVEVEVVWEAMHQNDRRFLSRMISNVDPMLIPLYESLLVDHFSLRKEWRLNAWDQLRAGASDQVYITI